MATLEEFLKLQFKIARVLDAKLHPNADRLLVLQVDSGSGPKEIVAGIANHYRPEDLTGKHVVIIDNLEPATIRGVVSNGMILAAQDGASLALVVPEKPVAPGATVK